MEILVILSMKLFSSLLIQSRGSEGLRLSEMCFYFPLKQNTVLMSCLVYKCCYDDVLNDSMKQKYMFDLFRVFAGKVKQFQLLYLSQIRDSFVLLNFKSSLQLFLNEKRNPLFCLEFLWFTHFVTLCLCSVSIKTKTNCH